jgi:outer membrane receptor protein involved in Fe transport
MYTGDVQPITYNAGRPVQVTLRLPSDRKNGVRSRHGLFLQDKWSMGRVTLNLGLRYDNFVGESRESSVLPEPFQRRHHVRRVLRWHSRPG